MITQLNKVFWLMGIAALAFFSCKKSGTFITATSGTQPGLTASTNILNYAEADSASNAVTFTYTPSDFGYQAAINYDIQFSTKDSNFTKFTDQSMSGTSISYLVKDFNTLVIGLKYSAGITDTVYVRVKATAADSLYRYSDTLAIVVTPYETKRVITYPALYMPGDYQGWSPGAAVIAKLYSPTSSSAYEGFIDLPSADNQFLITPAPTFDNKYTEVTATTMVYNGGNNFDIAGAGYYLINADTQADTWSATLQNWSIIGDFNGWSDASFSFDAVNQVLVDTLTIPAAGDGTGGALKFRANQSWDGSAASPNYGGTLDPNTGNVALSLGGSNIAIAKPGVYVFTLDLRVPSEPLCSIIKQ